jgi:UTP:GlnB (protein PII) uridylyltransferase
VQVETHRFPPFYETMPHRYRQLFHGATVQQHEAIVARRGGAPAYAQIWRRLPQGGAIVCVVADDRAGIFSSLGVALATQSIDLLAAQVYGRKTPWGTEVVDLLWLRRDEEVAPAIVAADVARVADFLGGLMNGDLRSDGRPLRRSIGAQDATLVHYEGESGGPVAMTLETVERPGLFRAVTLALEATGVRILRSRRVPGVAGRVVHRFVLAEHDGAVPDQYRRGLFQSEVLRVVELLAHRRHGAVEDDGAMPTRFPVRSALTFDSSPARSADAGIFIDEANPIFLQ